MCVDSGQGVGVGVIKNDFFLIAIEKGICSRKNNSVAVREKEFSESL